MDKGEVKCVVYSHCTVFNRMCKHFLLLLNICFGKENAIHNISKPYLLMFSFLVFFAGCFIESQYEYLDQGLYLNSVFVCVFPGRKVQEGCWGTSCVTTIILILNGVVEKYYSYNNTRCWRDWLLFRLAPITTTA